MWVRRSVYRILVGKPEGRRPLGSRKHGEANNTKMNLKEIG
jgi:hypothetical protein